MKKEKNSKSGVDKKPRKEPFGRPTKYSKELAIEICEQIAITRYGLDSLCKLFPHFPNPANIFRWIIKHDDFREMYESAREQQCNVMADQILSVAYDDSQDAIETENGTKINGEFVNRSRLKIDSLKWLLTKLQPRKYGDRVQNDTSISFVPHEDALRLLEKK